MDEIRNTEGLCMLDVLELKPGGGVGSVHDSLHLCLSVHDFMFAPKASRKNANGPNAHVSATLSGLIHANVSGVVGSGSSFTTTVLFLPYRHVPRCLLWDLD